MERYFKVSESELIQLLMDSARLLHLDNAGVDNWYDGGMVNECFEEACKEAGLPESGEGYTYTYEDLAQVYLKDYPEVK